MKCLNCKSNNNDNANYCYKCGNRFTEEDREIAKKKGIGGFFRFLIKIKNTYSLSFITDKMWFRVSSILLILFLGIFNVLKNGNNFRILDSEYYTYKYNQIKEEYYLYTDEEETPLSLYIPSSNEDIVINYYDKENNLIKSNTYTKDDNINVNTNTLSDNYYTIIYNKDTIKLRVYDKSYDN